MDEVPVAPKSSSCRGVAFEIKHHKVYAPNPVPSFLHPPPSQKSVRVLSSSFRAIERSLSRPSSHFCDLEEEESESQNENDEEKQLPQPQPQPRPKKNDNSRLATILLDQGLFTVYKRLFVVCLTLNVVALVLAFTNHFDYAKRNAVVFALGNVLALTLCRSEATLRVVFWLVVKILGRSWIPLVIKTATTSFLQSLGGIHSGCGVSSLAWLVYSIVLTVRNSRSTPTEIVAVAYAILFLLFLSCMAAFPLVRHLHHNVFERTHRFAGWSALALLWIFVILTVEYDPETKSYYDITGPRLVKQQAFWLTLAITFFIILPWTTIRKVPVTATSPSGHATLLKFSGGVKPGILARLSRSPLSEWHAFGIISDNKDSHTILAGAVGDFTKGLVTNPPSNLWVRSLHFAGLPYLVNMYDRVVLVATGSGICVFLSFLMQPCKANVKVVWVAKGIEENFGREIKERLSGDERVVVHDTAVMGRPNVAEMAVAAAEKWRAEAVVVTSNPQGSRDVVMACKAAGFAAFGPIWDS